MRQLIACLTLLMTLGVHADEETPYISVSAEGWVEAVPDTLVFTVVLRQTGKNMEEVREAVDRTTEQVVDAARDADIEKDDIDSSQIVVRPEYEWREGARRYLGENVQRNVVLKLREIDRFGELVQELTRLDVHEIQSPRLRHSRQQELEMEALEAALENGREKARRIARHLKVDLGPVLRVEELAAGGVIQPRMMAAEAMRSDGPTAPTFNLGKQRLTAQVTIRFEID